MRLVWYYHAPECVEEVAHVGVDPNLVQIKPPRVKGALQIPRRCSCPGSVPWSAAGWPAAGGMAYSVVRLALAKSRWLFAAL